MTAYARNASGDFDNAAQWTPNGVPDHSLGDTFTCGVFTIDIPVSKTWNAPAGTLTGTSVSNRARINVYGTLTINANWTVNAWNHITQYGSSIVDYRGNAGLRYQSTSGNGENRYTTSGTSESSWALITKSDYVSGEPTSVMSTATVTAAADGLWDVSYLVINNMASVLFGSGSGTNLMSHFRMVNCVFDSAGFFKTSQFSRLANDFIFENIDIRHSHPADISSAYFMELLAERNIAGTPTGIKRFKNVTARFDDERSAKYLRAISLDYFTDIGFYSDCVIFRLSSPQTAVTITNSSARTTIPENTGQFQFGDPSQTGNVYDNNVYLVDGTDYVYTGTIHGFENQALPTFTNNYVEEIFLQTGLDGSDWYAAPLTGTVTITRNIFVMQNGGVIVNSFKGDTSANITMDHNTYISKYSNGGSSNPYGSLMRTETGKRFVGGTNSLNNNLAWVLDTSGSSDGNIAAVHFGSTVALNDQLDNIITNNYHNMGVTLSLLYRGVTSSTKTLGDATYGGSDTFLDPQMTNYPMTSESPLIAFAESKGKTTTKQLWGELIKINGFNESTRRQETASKINYGTAEVLQFVRNSVRPTNALLATAANDGTTIGAVEYEAPASSGGGLTSSGLTSSGLTRVGLT